MIVVGLTGSIGSGKSFIINFFKSKQIPIYCADNEVKKILDKDVYTKRKIIKIFPSACVNKKIDKILYHFVKDSDIALMTHIFPLDHLLNYHHYRMPSLCIRSVLDQQL